MATKKTDQSAKNNVWGDISTLVEKAVSYMDGQMEKSANKKNQSLAPMVITDSKAIDHAYMDRVQKALPLVVKTNEEMIRRKSYEYDKDLAMGDFGYRDKNSPISFEVLRRMSLRDSIVSAVIMTRCSQVSNFSRPQRDRYGMGFKVMPKNQAGRVTEKEQKICKELEEWVSTCGFMDNRDWKERINFEEFLRRIVQDRLTYDAVTVEVIPCMDGTIHHFVPVSSGTIRFASPRIWHSPDLITPIGVYWGDREDEPSRPEELEPEIEDYKYLQVYQGQIVEGFTEDELIYRQGNPTNEPAANGYSIPELERLVNVVSSHLYAETHNRQFFTGGFSTPGFLHFKADIPQEQMDGLRRALESQMTGAQNAFRTALLATEEDVQWIPVTTNNKDMEWREWMNYLIKIICAIFQIDTGEIGFWDLAQGGGSLNEGNRNEVLLKQSRDKGLRPLLRFVESIVNDDVFRRLGDEICENYEFRFVGLETEERREEMERHNVEVRSKKTVNEIRAETGLPPLANMDNMILDPIYYQWWMQFSPEAIELGVKNEYYRQILQKEYGDKLAATLGQIGGMGGTEGALQLPEEEMNYEQSMPMGEGEGELRMSRKVIRKSQSRPLKVEYYKLPAGA